MTNCNWKQLWRDIDAPLDKVRCMWIRRAVLIAMTPVVIVLGLSLYIMGALTDFWDDITRNWFEPCWMGTYHNDDVERRTDDDY